MTRDADWATLIGLVEGSVSESENTQMLETFREFKSIYREDKEAVDIRKKALGNLRTKNEESIDQILSELPPERKLPSQKEIALEMSQAVAKIMLDLPQIYQSSLRNLDSNSDIVWKDESGDTQENLLQYELLKEAISSQEIRSAAQIVLDIIEDGEKNGWQV